MEIMINQWQKLCHPTLIGDIKYTKVILWTNGLCFHYDNGIVLSKFLCDIRSQKGKWNYIQLISHLRLHITCYAIQILLPDTILEL
jgi:hypothetical protein